MSVTVGALVVLGACVLFPAAAALGIFAWIAERRFQRLVRLSKQELKARAIDFGEQQASPERIAAARQGERQAEQPTKITDLQRQAAVTAGTFGL